MSPLSARLEYADEQRAHHHSCKTSAPAAAFSALRPLRTVSLANHPSLGSIGIGGERTFPGKWSSLTNMRNKGGSRPSSEGGREGRWRTRGERKAFNSARRESYNKFRRRIASFRHPLPSGTFFPSFFGNVLSAGGRSLSLSSPTILATRAHRNAHQQNGGAAFPPFSFLLSCDGSECFFAV